MVNIDPSRGIADWFANPRFSTGYGDARHLATIIVENHSLKPYDRRVLGTYVLLESAMRIAGKSSNTLRAAIKEDRQSRVAALPLAYTDDEIPSKTIGLRRHWLPPRPVGDLRTDSC